MRLIHTACWFLLLTPLVAWAGEPPVDQDGRPRIKKLGTIDVDKVENAPIVFRGKLYRCEWYRNKGCFHFVEHDTGRTTPEFAQGWCFANAFVAGDTVYRNTATDPEVVEMALAEQRSILTQDRGILKLKKVTHGYLVRSPHVHEQVVEVLRRFDLMARIDPFSRCTQCNGLIRAVDKADVQDELPPRTREYYHEFFRCEACGKVYWKGTHFSRMAAEVQELLSRGSGPQDCPAMTTT